MEICSAEQCTGCSACANICPVSAIHMKADGKGFLHPEIDLAACISCKRCVQVCPVNHPRQLFTPLSVQAVVNKKSTVRMESSSGGVFSLLAEEILKSGGIVFGAGFDAEWNVTHMSVETASDLAMLRGSKYVQSRIGDVYQRAEHILKSGKAVLFSGTPCQIAGLRNYLQKPYENLLTVDILCHGVPSPAVYQKYLQYLEDTYNSEVDAVCFRKKSFGWKDYRFSVRLKNGKEINCSQRDSFMGGFLKNLYLRDSCSECPYASTNRIGDITLGDYWGYQETPPEYMEDDNRGISLVMVNTSHGQLALDRIRNHTVMAARTAQDAARGNPVLCHSFERAPDCDVFWKDFVKSGWEELQSGYFPCLKKIEDISTLDICKRYSYGRHHAVHRLKCVCKQVLRKLLYR